MSYNLVESSTEISPVELYKFYTNSAVLKTYNSGAESVTYLGETYIPELIEASDVEFSDELEAKVLNVRVSRKSSIAALFTVYAPIEQVWLNIYRKHINDPDSEYVRYWTGLVSGVEHSKDDASLLCKPIDTAFSKIGLFKNFGSLCQHMVYDAGCKVGINQPQYKQQAIITSITKGTVLEAEEFAKWTSFSNPTPPIGLDSNDVPQGWWTNGFIVAPSGEVRMITSHGNEISGTHRNQITILTGLNTLEIGDTVDIIAGCARDIETCKNKFDNVVNYGGFPYIPLNNPFQYKIVTNTN